MHPTKRKGPAGYVQVALALKKFDSAIDDWSEHRSKSEAVALFKASGRVLAQDIVASINIPSFAKAAMDGYALRSADTMAARLDRPVTLQLVGNSSAGETKLFNVRRGETVSVATGARLPVGSDAVVMVENSQTVGNRVKIFQQAKRGQHISPVGEDLKKGRVILKRGTWLNPQDIGLIATLGVSNVPVVKKPMVAVIATGNELVEPGKKLGGSSIYESNRYMLFSMIRDCGGEPVDLGICKDDRAAIASRLRKSVHECDMVVVCGGTSVGQTDYVPELVKGMGRLVVHGVAMKPGSPTGFGIVKGKPVLLTPGFPVSAFVAFYTFGRHALFKALHTRGPSNAIIEATLDQRVELHADKMRSFIRVRLSSENGRNIARPISHAASRLISSLASADGMVAVERNAYLEKGERVQVIPFRSFG